MIPIIVREGQDACGMMDEEYALVMLLSIICNMS